MLHGIIKLQNQGWYDMAAGDIKMVVWPIHIDGDQIDHIQAVLLVISLAQLHQGLLGDAVWGVRFFWIAFPKVAFRKGVGVYFG